MDNPPFMKKIAKREDRKRRASREKPVSPWLGLFMMGKVGWTIVVPGLIGIAIGSWLDQRSPGSYSWALILFGVGTGFGCINALHWLGQEHERMKQGKGPPPHD